jgi:hypothetical protein
LVAARAARASFWVASIFNVTLTIYVT